MTVLFLLSLVTVVGLFFVYQIIAEDYSRIAAQRPRRNIVKNIIQAAELLEHKIVKAAAVFFQKKPQLKVEPILSLKDYYSKESSHIPSEIDLTRKDVTPVHLKKIETADIHADLKIRFEALQAAYQKLERLSHEKMVKFDQIQHRLEAELTLHQDFEKIKVRLEQEIVDIRRELAEKDRIIESLQNAPVNRISQLSPFPESPRQEEFSRDFVRLPADLMDEAKQFLGKNLTQGGQNKLFESLEDENIVLPYSMPSEDEIIRSLKSKKYSL